MKLVSLACLLAAAPALADEPPAVLATGAIAGKQHDVYWAHVGLVAEARLRLLGPVSAHVEATYGCDLMAIDLLDGAFTQLRVGLEVQTCGAPPAIGTHRVCGFAGVDAGRQRDASEGSDTFIHQVAAPFTYPRAGVEERSGWFVGRFVVEAELGHGTWGVDAALTLGARI